MRLRATSIALAGAAFFLSPSCGGGSRSPAAPAPAAPTAAPVAAPTPTPAPVIPGYSAVCAAIGYGTSDVTCEGGDSAFLADVEDAIDTLIGTRPDIFNFKTPGADGGLRVVDRDAYYQGVVDILGAKKGLCAAPSFGPVTLLVKRTNEFSEAFVILSPRDTVRKGPSVFAAHCAPAEFPLRPEDAIEYIRVAFFGINCPAGIVPPPNQYGRIPEGCTGYVTATPKDRSGLNVPNFIHGSDITWELKSGEGRVTPRAVEVPFNYALVARSVGNFSFCATVQGVTGCLDGRVIHAP